MNQLLSLEPSQIPTLAKNKMVANAISAELEGASSKESTDFLSMILAQLNNKIAMGEKQVEISLEDIDAAIPLTPKLSEEVEGLSIERATFSQLLQLVEVLNDGSETKKFPVFGEKLTTLLKDAAILQEFKDVKSLKDLVKLGEKYDLGLEKLTITTEEIDTLERKFPILAEKEFFQPKKAIISSESILNTKKPESSMVLAKKEEPTPLRDLMKSLDTQAPKESQKAEIKAEIKPEIKPEVSSPKESTAKAPIIESTIKPKVTEALKEAQMTSKDVLVKEPLNKPIENIPKAVAEPKEIKPIKVSAESVENVTKEVKEEAPKVTPKTTVENASKFNQSSIFEQTLQAVKPQKPVDTMQLNKEAIVKLAESVSESEMGASENQGESDTKNENRQNTLIKEIAKTATNQPKTTIIKQTMSQFAQDFKEQVENYKPPLMKVQMALNPKNLGEVEVTLVNRGNALHVNFTSTSQTMNLFVQNQAEFKNSLVNMGFTNLEMNFSDQRENKNNQGGDTTKFSHQGEELEEFSNEMTSLDLVIPDYA